MIEAKTRLVLDKRRLRNDGSFPIKVRVNIFRKSIDIATGSSIQPKYWNDSHPYVKSNWSGNSRRLSSKLEDYRSQIDTKLFDLIDKDELYNLMTNKEIKNLLTEERSSLLCSYLEYEISELKKIEKFGTARVYNTLLKSCQSFLLDIYSKEDYPLERIDFSWLEKYERWYLSKNKKSNSKNGLSVYLRSLRALINKAIKRRHISIDQNPFSSYSIKEVKTQKKALSPDDLVKLAQCDCKTQWHQRAKDYFFASYYAAGISIKDLLTLKLKDIEGGRLRYRRSKTGTILNIYILDALQEIFDKYAEHKNQEDYIFDICSSSQSPNERYNTIKNATKKCNKALKEIAISAGITNIVTTYTARHSFASHQLLSNESVEKISQLMGHSDIKTTQIYLKGFDDKELDKTFHNLVVPTTV